MELAYAIHPFTYRNSRKTITSRMIAVNTNFNMIPSYLNEFNEVKMLAHSVQKIGNGLQEVDRCFSTNDVVHICEIMTRVNGNTRSETEVKLANFSLSRNLCGIRNSTHQLPFSMIL